MGEGTLHTFQVLKADAEHRVLYGFGIVCEKADASGQLVQYFDDGSESAPDFAEGIDETEMMKAAVAFMASNREIEQEHGGPALKGMVLFGFPLTKAIAKSLDITTQRTGFLIGVRPDDVEVFEKAKRGELRGFSMYGTCKAREVAA